MAFHRGTRAHLARAWAFGLALLLIGLSARAQPVAVEYFHSEFGHYFITTFVDEIGKLDNGTFTGWQRTGQSFRTYPLATNGAADVCRFFSTAFGARSSHFYTPSAAECATVKANADWQFEALVFDWRLPGATGDWFELTPAWTRKSRFSNPLKCPPTATFTTLSDADVRPSNGLDVTMGAPPPPAS